MEVDVKSFSNWKNLEVLLDASENKHFKFSTKSFEIFENNCMGDRIEIFYKGIVLTGEAWYFTINPKYPFSYFQPISEAPEELKPFLERIISEFPKVFNENLELAKKFLKEEEERKAEKETLSIMNNWIKFIKRGFK